MRAVIDLTFLRFGRLVVIGLGEKPEGYKTGGPFWRARCDCGRIKDFNGASLRQGKTRSCGCLGDEARRGRGLDFEPGTRKGRLVILGQADMGNDTRRGRYFHCVCDCGKKRTVRGSSLKNGETKSCGCLRAEKSIERLTKSRFEARSLPPEAYNVGPARYARYLTDGYVRSAIVNKHKKVGIKTEDVSPELIRIKRAQLKLHREIKKGKAVLNELS